jgi:signal transduction histidine kinase
MQSIPLLLDSFFKTKETGVGLGLPIVQSIIEAHIGSFELTINRR